MPIRVAGPQREDQRQRWNEKTTKHDWRSCSSQNANSRKLESKMQDSEPTNLGKPCSWHTMRQCCGFGATSGVSQSPVPSEGGGVQSTGNGPKVHEARWLVTTHHVFGWVRDRMSSLHDEIADIKSSWQYGWLWRCEAWTGLLMFHHWDKNPSLNIPTAQESRGSPCIRPQERGRVLVHYFFTTLGLAGPW